MEIDLFSHELLKPIARFLNDPEVTEIMLNKPGVIFVEKRDLLQRHEVTDLTLQRTVRICQLIANKNQQELNEEKPLLSGKINSFCRVQLVIPPVSETYCFCIRKKKDSSYNLTELAEKKLFEKVLERDFVKDARICEENDEKLYQLYQQKKWLAFIKYALLVKKNIIVSGATSSGKTTFLNACLNELPLKERLIVLEDTCELIIRQENKVQLLCCQGGGHFKVVTLQDLVKCSLRLRPDRLIIGEVRGEEISDFMTAALTGHAGILTTVHAENPTTAFVRMNQMYRLQAGSQMKAKEIAEELQQVVDIILQLQKKSYGRRLTEVWFKYAEQRERR